MRTIEEQIGETLANEAGMGGVCIWRPRTGDPRDYKESSFRQGITVKDWLLDPKNQGGVWLIDGGWGGPPGPIHIRWNKQIQEWENGGFCGRLFDEKERT